MLDEEVSLGEWLTEALVQVSPDAMGGMRLAASFSPSQYGLLRQAEMAAERFRPAGPARYSAADVWSELGTQYVARRRLDLFHSMETRSLWAGSAWAALAGQVPGWLTLRVRNAMRLAPAVRPAWRSRQASDKKSDAAGRHTGRV